MSASLIKSSLESAPQPAAGESLPGWVRELSHAYVSGTTCQFVLHGNVYDLVRSPTGGDSRYIPLADFLSNQIFGKWNLVLLYDLSRGLRPLAGTNPARLREMVDLFSERLGEVKALPRDPTSVLLMLDRFFEKLLVESADLSKTLSVAVIIDYAKYVAPALPPGGAPREINTNLVTLLNWAQSPYLKRINAAFILVAEKLSDLNPRLVRNPHVLSIEIPFPDESQRQEYIEWAASDMDFSSRCEFT
ncbi:MAG: hypothetical protein HYZ27_08440, partial [Deltaproteobacteria bacterium]|nr:hypothetical protein [Deltaproteobacteria bacterium]